MSTVRLEIRVSKQSIMAFNPVKCLKQSSLPRIGQSPRKVKLDLLPQLLLWSHSPCWDHLGARTWCFLTLTSVLVLRTRLETQCAKAYSLVPVCCTSAATFTQEVPTRERLWYKRTWHTTTQNPLLFFSSFLKFSSKCLNIVRLSQRVSTKQLPSQIKTP